MNYKDTLLLPSTDFPIKPNFAKNEQAVYAQWENQYEIFKSEGVEGTFLLHDGPPYANGDIHVGHAMNKILKDFAAKWHYFKDYSVEFVPGWDCHGLPIEQKARGKLTDTVEIRQACRKYAAEQVEKQKAQFKSLGIIADWNNPYLTMDLDFEVSIYQSLVQLLNKGLLYSQKKPVFWSWAERTALAEAEVEYKDRTDESAYVLFDTSLEWKLAVWTTTPWTLPANEMVVGAKCNYVLARAKNTYVVVAEKCFSHLVELGFLDRDPIRDVDWTALKDIKVKALFGKGEKPLLFDDFAAEDKGTGFVHVAPGHGPEDYQFAKMKEFAMPVGPDGKFTEEANELTGLELKDLHVFDANSLILDNLNVLGTEKITHSYPHCWRSGKPVIFRATEQWFLNVNKLKDSALNSLESVSFDSESAKERLRIMVETRPDWCISRQRAWGVPIAFLRHKTTGDVLFNYNKAINVFKIKGFDSWWSDPIEDFLPDDLNPADYEKVYDILDVWFDSGLTWLTLDHKSSLYLEGSDQYRGWFQSSLWLCQALMGEAPFEKLVSHGFVVDGQGQKMAKAKGNVISPLEVMKDYGAEILRFWVASTDYHKEMKINKEILNHSLEGYKKVRNTLRYLLANIDGTSKYCEEYRPVDSWIIHETFKMCHEVDTHFGKYEYHVGMQKLMEFINSKLSNVYMNSIKDSLYCSWPNHPNRSSIQSALEVILKAFVDLLRPILTYTIQEVKNHAPKLFKENSVFYRDRMSCFKPEFTPDFDSEYWLKALKDFHEAFDKLKQQGIVKDTLEVGIGLPKSADFPASDWFVVSFADQLVHFGELAKFGDGFTIYNSSMWKCARCWKRNRLLESQDLCDRCYLATKG